MSRRIFTRISGREQVSSAVPSGLAEKMSDSVGDRDEALRERALDDLVEKMMDGEKYPKRGNRGVCLDDILCDYDATRISQIIRNALFSKEPPATRFYDLQRSLEFIVKDHLTDSVWHDMRESELAEEENEAQKERMGK